MSLIAEGDRWWTRSPDPTNPVACATCHHDPLATREWAPSFPKFKPLPPPHARVMTLLQANAEAVERHYRLADPRPAAVAITAYLHARATGMPRSPGVASGQPVFPERLHALAESAARGKLLFDGQCGACHDAHTVAWLAEQFPRMAAGHAESLEGFIASHASGASGLDWDSPAMADLLAHLADQVATNDREVWR